MCKSEQQYRKIHPLITTYSPCLCFKDRHCVVGPGAPGFATVSQLLATHTEVLQGLLISKCVSIKMFKVAAGQWYRVKERVQPISYLLQQTHGA